MFGLLVHAATFWLFGKSDPAVMLVGAAGMALGNGLMWASLLALISRAAGARDQGAVQGYASSGGALASIIGLILGGILFESIGTGVFAVSCGVFLAAVAVASSLGRALGTTRGRAEPAAGS